jgi:hypothetical protein
VMSCNDEYGESYDFGYQKQYLVIYLFAAEPCSGNVPNGNFIDCSRDPGTQCDYTCNDGYTKVTSHPVTCNAEGVWEGSLGSLCSGKICLHIKCFSISLFIHVYLY